jgi:protein subunit release factor A
VNIRQQDLKIDLYRSQGAGGDSPFTYEIKFAIILINSAADS